VGNLVFGLTEIPADGVVMGAGVFAMCPFNMTGGKIINNGTQNAPGSGIVVDDGGLLTLNGPVTISGNSVNVWSAPSGTVRRGPITLGEYFENYSEYPITVDTTSSYGSISVANVKTWWGSYSCLIGEQVAVVQFVPGKIALVSPGYSGYAPSSFRIFAGTFTIDDSTGCFILP
jgi:hypothetical protein